MGYRETCLALIDTGATRTCLTQSLIGRLGLEAKSKLLIASATSGPERRRSYGYSLGLFCSGFSEDAKTLYVIGFEFVAPWFQDNGNFDVLLGMDVLSQGRLTFERGGDFTFEFEF
jgi:hypothetical protein